jgi:hypothetical protein
MNSPGLLLAKATTSSQLIGAENCCDGLILMGPSKNFSMPLSNRGPVSFAPKFAAKLSCRSNTPFPLLVQVLSGHRPCPTFILSDQPNDIRKGIRISLHKA